jgi:phenylpropionate dioxygenase-like ring-hydroxylating dioxygenase large terminal subunit
MHQITGQLPGTTRFPKYDAASLGFENFWYPVLWSRELRGKPVALTLFGLPIVFVRKNGNVQALLRRCPLCGISFPRERSEFSGTAACSHDIRTFAIEERAGLVWIFNGTGEPPPLRSQVPEELLRDDAVIEGRITTRKGDWRYAAENGFDEGHVKYLHRDAWIVAFTHIPSYASVDVRPDDENDPWVTRNVSDVHFEANYPGLGVWPKKRMWKHKKRGVRVSIRMPGMLRVHYGWWIHFETYVPTVEGEHRYLQIAMSNARGIAAFQFRAFYRAYLSWIFHGQFNDQDAAMVELMTTPPEQLYRPDISLIAWRRLCETHASDR